MSNGTDQDQPPPQDAGAERRIDPFPYSENEDLVLPEDYEPTNFDVINGRGRKSYNHIANRRFRQLISMNLERYQNARCKVDKTLVVVGIVNSIRNSNPTGGFIKKDNKSGRWISMSDEGAREKVGHCLRDMIAAQRGKEEKKKTIASSVGQNGKGDTTTFTKSIKHKSSKAVDQIMDTEPNPWLETMKSNTDRPIMSSQAEATAPGTGLWSIPPRGPEPGTRKNNRMAAFEASIPSGESMAASASAVASASRLNEKYNMPYPQASIPINLDAPVPPLATMSARGAMDRSHLPLSFSNIDAVSLQKGTLQDMSEQQRRILAKLECGFKGSVEELMEAVKSPE